VIVFSFRRRECEALALSLAKLDFNSEEEKAMVGEVFGNALQLLAEEDRQLPAVRHILPLLQRGIGVHHSGLLPILKELIEILFQEGLIKALFATENCKDPTLPPLPLPLPFAPHLECDSHLRHASV